MKKVVMLIGIVCMCLFVAQAFAEQAGQPQSATTPTTGLSKRNKAVIDQKEQAGKRREAITGKKKLSKHNRAKIEQTEKAKARQKTIQSNMTGTKMN